MNSGLAKEKFETLNKFLEEEFVLAHIDSKGNAVKLPAHLLVNPTVTLKLSRYFRGAIEILEDKVVADLLFDNNYFTCEIPFEALWGVTSAKGSNIIWPESAPTDILKAIVATADKEVKEGKGKKTKASAKAKPEKKAASHLKRIK